MLSPDPQHRITCADALLHPFFDPDSDGEDVDDAGFDESLIEVLRDEAASRHDETKQQQVQPALDFNTPSRVYGRGDESAAPTPMPAGPGAPPPAARFLDGAIDSSSQPQASAPSVTSATSSSHTAVPVSPEPVKRQPTLPHRLDRAPPSNVASPSKMFPSGRRTPSRRNSGSSASRDGPPVSVITRYAQEQSSPLKHALRNAAGKADPRGPAASLPTTAKSRPLSAIVTPIGSDVQLVRSTTPQVAPAGQAGRVLEQSPATDLGDSHEQVRQPEICSVYGDRSTLARASISEWNLIQ